MGDYTREGGKRLLQFSVPLQSPDPIDGRPERVAKSGPERETAMNHHWNRRDVLKGLVAASTAALVRPTLSACREDASIAAQPVEVQITPVSPHTFRLSILPVANNGSVGSIPFDGSLVQESWGAPIAKLRAAPGHSIAVASVRLEISLRPVSVTATSKRGDVIQHFAWDDNTGALSFLIGSTPLFGLGEGAATGMPIMRALWLHYPDDPKAVECGDEYLWGSSMLVAPVVEKGATTRQVYLPRGAWYDFWTGERLDGGREITRPVDLETIPLYVRAGSILPRGPVKQYAAEKVDAPLSVSIYPGADGSFLLYEDDGTSFNHRKGEWMGIQMNWNDARKAFSLHLASGSRMLPPVPRAITLKLGEITRNVTFEGKPVEVSFPLKPL